MYPYTINGKKYHVNSQASPPDTGNDTSKIKYYIIVMLEEKNLYSNTHIKELQKTKANSFIFIVLIVCCGSLVVLALIMCLVSRTSRRIIFSIDVMTKYTNELKKAPDLATKIKTIEKISKEDSLFKKISKRYD